MQMTIILKTSINFRKQKNHKSLFMQKNFRKIWSNPQDRLSLTHDKGLEWSFRQVWEYRAGNLGLLEVAERRALQLARGNTSHQEAIRGITQRIKTRYNR